MIDQMQDDRDKRDTKSESHVHGMRTGQTAMLWLQTRDTGGGTKWGGAVRRISDSLWEE